MSPAPARTSREAIVAAGRALLEEGGLDAVTMQAVADRVGVRAPSLYKRLDDRPALIAAIAGDVLEELGRALHPAFEADDPGDAVRIMADRYRAFAHGSPGAYQLLFTRLLPAAQPAAEANARASADLLVVAERLVGRERSLEAARLLTAFAHGFVSMELAGAFRLGGDVDAAFRFAVETLIEGLTARSTNSPPG
jgi:AcrR family transcriptional regulator